MSEIIENIGSAMTLCEYVMLNSRETNWRNVHETLRGYALEDVAVEELPETEEEGFCYVSIRETLIEIVNMFRIGGGYKYTDSGIIMMIRLFTKLYEELMDIVDPDDIEMLEDLIVASVNDALEQADKMEKSLKGDNPGMMGL